jgi:hypothetical protein
MWALPLRGKVEVLLGTLAAPRSRRQEATPHLRQVGSSIPAVAPRRAERPSAAARRVDAQTEGLPLAVWDRGVRQPAALLRAERRWVGLLQAVQLEVEAAQ